MNKLSALNQEAILYFEELSKNQSAIQAADQFITDTLDSALPSQDMGALLSLIPYIETGDGALACKHIGEIYRIVRILHIISLEQKYRKSPFCTGCISRKTLLEKYMLSLFSFRRLLFCLSETSTAEAVYFLRRNELSVFAVYTMTQDELIIPTEELYDKVIEIYSDLWDNENMQLFLSLIQSH